MHSCVCAYFSACCCPNLPILQLVKMAKRLKKEKVNVDIINFGEEVRHCWIIFHIRAIKRDALKPTNIFLFFFCIVLFSFPYLVLLYLNKLSPTICSGGEHREADCFYKYSKWEGGDGLPPGHSPSRTQSG